MCRKMTFLGIAAAALGLWFVGGVGSYVRAVASKCQESVKSNVPIELEIERARQMLGDLGPDIRRNMELIAKEEYALEQLDERIDAAVDRLDIDRQKLTRLKDALAQEQPVYYFAGRRFDPQQVRTNLARRFERFKVSHETMDNLRKMHTARNNSLTASRKKLENMLSVRRQLDLDLENLVARKQMIEAAETTSNYQFDDSRLAQIKEQITDLRSRIDVAERLVGVDEYFTDDIPLDDPAVGDIVDEVTAYLDTNLDEGHRLPEPSLASAE